MKLTIFVILGYFGKVLEGCYFNYNHGSRILETFKILWEHSQCQRTSMLNQKFLGTCKLNKGNVQMLGRHRLN